MPKVNLINVITLAAGLAATACAANAQEGVGDSAGGRAFAARVCSPCHAIAPDPHAPRMFEIAPDFQTITNTPGMTATALNAFMLTSHPKMPNLILSPGQSADVIAYILSLRERPRPSQTRPLTGGASPTSRIGERWRRFSRGWVGASN